MSYLGWANSEVETKSLPKAGKRLMLGSCDKQLATMRVDDKLGVIYLTAKLWNKEYELEFYLPEYIKARKIKKYALPTIRPVDKDDLEKGYCFDFAFIEQVVKSKGANIAGLDLGKVKPYQAVVINKQGASIGEYQASKKTMLLWTKLQRLQANRKAVIAKLEQYHKLLNSDSDGNNFLIDKAADLLTEKQRSRNKITRLKAAICQQQARELITKLEQHNVGLINLENLSWVTGKDYGGRWNHSMQQTAIIHAASRAGMKTNHVNPKDTSQTCCKCGERVTHKNNRLAYCNTCKQERDRDLLAALNIARDINQDNYQFPARWMRSTGECPSLKQSIINSLKASIVSIETTSEARQVHKSNQQ